MVTNEHVSSILPLVMAPAHAFSDYRFTAFSSTVPARAKTLDVLLSSPAMVAVPLMTVGAFVTRGTKVNVARILEGLASGSKLCLVFEVVAICTGTA